MSEHKHFTKQAHMVPELPSELQELVMHEWYLALWQRMHKRRAKDCMLFAHLRVAMNAMRHWEQEWMYTFDVDDQGTTTTVVEQDMFTLWVLDQDESVGWHQVLERAFILSRAHLGLVAREL